MKHGTNPLVARFGLGLLLLLLIIYLCLRTGRVAPVTESGFAASQPRTLEKTVEQNMHDQTWRRRFGARPSQSAEEVVAAKVSDFGRKRLEWVRATSLRIGKDIPPEVEKFFETLQQGDWNQIEESFASLAKRSAQYEGSTHWPELDPFWMAVLEAYGAAEQAHLWPAERLLEYGNAILGSLRPGMVYVGGTDPGRFIPSMLNETSEGEQHVVLTQNAFADSRYLEYTRALFGDRMILPSDGDSKKIFEEYIAAARQRLEHDQQFPHEPAQIKPGEKVELRNGDVSVSGQVAVMAINEKLLQWMLERNPEASFAVEESFPFRSTYKTAVPLGPIMEIRVGDAFEPEFAAETVDRWRDMRDHLAQGAPSEKTDDLKTYSHMAVSQANLLASHNYVREAESTYRLAFELFPRNTGAALSLSQFLSDSGRPDEGLRFLADFREKNPDLAKDLEPH